MSSSAPAGAGVPTPTATPGAKPVIAFDGDCANVLEPAEIESLLGEGAVLDTQYVPYRVGIETLGGLDCRWSVGDSAQSMSVVALPLSEVPDEFRRELGAPACDVFMQAATCRLGRAFGDVWIMTREQSEGLGPDESALNTAVAAAGARVPDYAGPIAPSTQPEWWAARPSCDSLGARMGLSDLLGDGYVTGWWEHLDPTQFWEHRLTADAGVEYACEWFPDYSADNGGDPAYGIVSAWVWPHGTGIADRVLAGGHPIDVVGAQRATIDGQTASATDGVNVVAVTAEVKGDPVELLSRFLAAQRDG